MVTVHNGIRTFTVAEAAEKLGVVRNTVHHHIRSGKLRVVAYERSAGRGRIHVAAGDVEALVARRKERS